MRIGLYGLPTAGKSYILEKVDCLDVLAGSSLLKEYVPDFQELHADKKKDARMQLARNLKRKDYFIMDGHYAFGDEVAFTEEDGSLYDVFLYIFVEPAILKERMEASSRNRKYLVHDIQKWQESEVTELRRYCQEHDKDFYVIDNPGQGYFKDVGPVLDFIRNIKSGYSCVNFAMKCVSSILKSTDTKEIHLTDGDKTLIKEDSSGSLGYRTHLFDGNFYTGFQSWRHVQELRDFLVSIGYGEGLSGKPQVHLNNTVYQMIQRPCVILTSGCEDVWKEIAKDLQMPLFYGSQMSAETKFFITKFLQEAGMQVTAYGDSLNDYYMLKRSDKGFLITKTDGSVSRSLKGKDLEGLYCLN